MTDHQLFDLQIHLGGNQADARHLIVEAHRGAPRTEMPVNAFTSNDGKQTVIRPL